MENQLNTLIKSCIGKEPKAMRLLYEMYKAPLFRICLRYGKDRMEAEDFLQDAFVKIIEDLPRFRGEGSFEGWMKRITVNTCLQHLRKRKRKPYEMEFEDRMGGYEETSFEFETVSRAKLVTMLIQQLPKGYRTVFNLYVVESYSHKEIAEMLNISVGSSKSQLFKAKAMLRKLLEEKMSKNSI